MFYEENKIADVLKCTHCRQKLDEPKILPCGKTICNSCIQTTLESFNQTEESFMCLICNCKHFYNKGGFPVNEALKAILDQAPVEVSRGDLIETLKEDLAKIERKTSELENSLVNRVANLKEYCSNLRTEVDLETETRIQETQDQRNTMIKLINDYETEAINSMKNGSEEMKNFQKRFQEMKEFCQTSRDYLELVKIDDTQVKQVYENAKILDTELKRQARPLNSFIFNKKKIHYVCDENANKVGVIKFESLDRIALNEYKQIDISEILSNAREIKVYAENDYSFYILYLDNNFKLKQATISTHKTIYSSTFDSSSHCFSKFNKMDDCIIAIKNNSTFLYKFDLKCVLIGYKDTGSVVKLIKSSHEYIYCAQNNKLNVFNKQLDFTKTIRFSCPIIPNDIKQIERENDRYFFLSGTHLQILNKTDGKLIESFKVTADEFLTNKKYQDIVLLDKSKCELNYYSFDGTFMGNLAVDQYSDGLELVRYKYNTKIFFDQKSRKILFKREYCPIF